MKKNIKLIIGFVLILSVWVYFAWQGGAELRELNKDLPEGISVVERNGGQVIVNEKDGYEIIVPEKWGGLRNIDTLGADLSMKAKNTEEWIAIEIYELSKINNLKSFLENEFESKLMRFNPVILGEEKIGDYKVIRVIDETPVSTFYFCYFQNDSKIYEIYTDYLEESVQDIILNMNF